MYRTVADAALIEAAQRIASLVRACRDGHHPFACSGVKTLRNTSAALAATHQLLQHSFEPDLMGLRTADCQCHIMLGCRISLQKIESGCRPPTDHLLDRRMGPPISITGDRQFCHACVCS